MIAAGKFDLGIVSFFSHNRWSLGDLLNVSEIAVFLRDKNSFLPLWDSYLTFVSLGNMKIILCHMQALKADVKNKRVLVTFLSYHWCHKSSKTDFLKFSIILLIAWVLCVFFPQPKTWFRTPTKPHQNPNHEAKSESPGGKISCPSTPAKQETNEFEDDGGEPLSQVLFSVIFDKH